MEGRWIAGRRDMAVWTVGGAVQHRARAACRHLFVEVCQTAGRRGHYCTAEDLASHEGVATDRLGRSKPRRSVPC